ncbi:YkvA family protein [Mycobacterium sp. NPDC048908]|uniref:YkvA family protein n=1 Tax=Mycobacterium sp. NPDC048908 TaxID=3364292 RepID=UPI0037101A80
MWHDWWTIPLGIVGGVLLVWAVLVAVLWLSKPGDYDLKQAARLLPDLIRLVKRLASDPETPRGVRIRLALLLAYLALPFDLIPDFIPVLGYADDAIIVALVLRSATRRAGSDALAKHWPGTEDGLTALKRLCRLNEM